MATVNLYIANKLFKKTKTKVLLLKKWFIITINKNKVKKKGDIINLECYSVITYFV